MPVFLNARKKYLYMLYKIIRSNLIDGIYSAELCESTSLMHEMVIPHSMYFYLQIAAW